jgi:formylglycine-generating enzyme required for sulfatase activity
LAAGGVVGLLTLAAAVVLFRPAPRGLVCIESDDPSLEIVLDETGPTVQGVDPEPVALRPGEHRVLIRRGDSAFEVCRFVLKKGETVTLRVEWLPGKVQVVQGRQVIGSTARPLPATFTNRVGMEFVLVPGGKAWLGGGGGKPGDREVQIAQDFYMGRYEVTQEEWRQVSGRNPGHFSRGGAGKEAVKGLADEELNRFPVESVSWEDAQHFLQELNERVREHGWVYRLPTAAEWEYACRGGPSSERLDSAFDFYTDKPANQLRPGQANFRHNGGLRRTCQVGSYRPNRLGLYDMHGNVWEWCDDLTKGADGAPHRVFRGGGWFSEPDSCRAAGRGTYPPRVRRSDVGLRVVRATR